MARGNIFRTIPRPKVGKNNFNLSHDHKTTFDMGYLIPILCEDALPGDTWFLQAEEFIRAAALIAPVMERIDVRMDYFFVPNRLMWPSWERFINGTIINKPPYIEGYDTVGNTPDPGDLGDYLGYPVEQSVFSYDAMQVSAFPVSAYNFIWNEFYRQQNVQDVLEYECVNDDNSILFLGALCSPPQLRNWQHDYFTSAQPWPTAAGTTVDVPITHAQDDVTVRRVDTAAGSTGVLEADAIDSKLQNAAGTEVYLDTRHEASIADLRTSIKLQEWLEKLLIGGGRLRELLYSFFGVDNQDMRLQVPELIGSSLKSLKISEVLSTAETLNSLDQSVNPVGQMAGHGIAVGSTPRFKYFVREHGWILGILNVQPSPTYKNQGLHRKFTRETYLDYFWPQFANIGEQAILNREIYANAPAATRDATFAYAPRYSEYKFINNRVSGEMATTLDFWNFAREFSSTPPFDEDFLFADVRLDPFAVPGKDTMIAQIYHNVNCIRPIPRYSIARTGGR